MSYLKVGQVSGRYDRALALVKQNSRYMRHVAQCMAIGRTELAKFQPSDFVGDHPNDRFWDTLQLKGGQAQELIFEYDKRFLVQHSTIKPWKQVLTKLVYFRKGGGQTPEFTAAMFPMVDRDGVLIFFGVFHGPLANGPRRVLAQLGAARGMAKVSRDLQKKYPNARVVFVGDINKNKRDPKAAKWMVTNIETPGDLVNVWDGYVPDKGGTHGRADKAGRRSILDTVFTNAMVRKTGLLFDGINDSDHDSWYTILSTKHIALRLLKRKTYRGPRPTSLPQPEPRPTQSMYEFATYNVSAKDNPGALKRMEALLGRPALVGLAIQEGRWLQRMPSFVRGWSWVRKHPGTPIFFKTSGANGLHVLSSGEYEISKERKIEPAAAGPTLAPRKSINYVAGELSGRKVVMGSLHLVPSVHLPKADQLSEDQLAKVNAFCKSWIAKGYEVILGGDFNMLPNHPNARTLLLNMQVLNRQEGPTRDGRLIDWVLASHGILDMGGEVMPGHRADDHDIAIAQFGFKVEA